MAQTLLAVALVAGVSAAAVGATPAPAHAATHYCGEPPVTQIANDGPGDIFGPACHQHDICYWGGTHGYPYYGNRYNCDVTFYAMMWDACNRRASGLNWAGCWSQATAYYEAVRYFGVFYWAGNWWDNV